MSVYRMPLVLNNLFWAVVNVLVTLKFFRFAAHDRGVERAMLRWSHISWCQESVVAFARHFRTICVRMCAIPVVFARAFAHIWLGLKDVKEFGIPCPTWFRQITTHSDSNLQNARGGTSFAN